MNLIIVSLSLISISPSREAINQLNVAIVGIIQLYFNLSFLLVKSILAWNVRVDNISNIYIIINITPILTVVSNSRPVMLVKKEINKINISNATFSAAVNINNGRYFLNILIKSFFNLLINGF